jgi:hypothetical protein
MPKPDKGESKQDFLRRCTGDVMAEGKESDQAFAMCNAFWDDSQNQRSVLTLSAPVEFKKKSTDKKRTFAITGYTGQPLDTWFGRVVFDINGMQTKEKIPVLREHARDRVVGFGRAWKDESNFYVSGDFSAVTDDAREVLQLADEGYPWQASVGIWPRQVKKLENDKAKATVNGTEISGPAEIWTQSDVGEISFVSLGRDDNTAAVSFSASEGKARVNIEYVSPEEINNGASDAPPDKGDDEMELTLELLQKEHRELFDEIYRQGVDAGVIEGEKAERERVIDIMTADGDEVEAKKMIEDGTPATECYRRFFEAEKKKRALGLKELEASAPESQGVEPPVDPEPVDHTPPDKKVEKLALELSQEENISFDAAVDRVLAENPKLAQSYRDLWANPRQ